MASRSTPVDMASAAEQALALALDQIGARVRQPGDLTVRLPNGDMLTLVVQAFAVLDEARATRLARQVKAPTVAVADLVSGDARAILEDAGIGWLDRRGHLRVVGPGVWIDRDTDPFPRARAGAGERTAIRGAASLGVAASHLINGQRPKGVRELARSLHLSPAAVSKARAALDRAGLLAAGPDARRALFWAMTEAWHPVWVDLPREPPRSGDLVAGGTRAAAALGAPIIATSSYPVELYAPSSAMFERVRLRAGGSRGAGAKTVARLAMAPTPLVADPTTTSSDGVSGWPIAHALFVALDLATDPARGGEALEGWDPPGWPRAW